MGGGRSIDSLYLHYYANTRAIIFVVDSQRVRALGTTQCEYCFGEKCTKTKCDPCQPLLKRSECYYDAKYWLWHMLHLRRDLNAILSREDSRKGLANPKP